MTIKGSTISLRPASISDTDLILHWENDKENWLVSNTTRPYTKAEIEEFINDQKGIYSDKQLRLIICTNQKKSATIGCIDLFNYNHQIKKAGIGVLISQEFRNKGFASEALDLLIKHTFNTLNLNKLYCHVHADNLPSIKLFKKNGFSETEQDNNTLLLELINR